MGTTLPERGRNWDGLREDMLAMRGEDLDWRRERLGGLTFTGTRPARYA